jgi:RHS repeat-associated protein
VVPRPRWLTVSSRDELVPAGPVVVRRVAPIGDLHRRVRTGQLFDSVGGLTYNYFRDYDAATGSYAQSDPLGLDAGMMSTYSYAAQAPNLYDDPDGRLLPAVAYPAAMAYARCFGQCTAVDTLAEVVAYGQECVNGAGILKNCAVECLNPLNYIGVGKVVNRAKGVPKAPKKWLPPTNPPQLPPKSLPPGHTVRVEGPNQNYPDGYWRQYDSGGNPVNPSTGKQPGSVSKAEAAAQTHVPLPPGVK